MYGQSMKAFQQYRQIGVHSTVEEASPHRLIQMLMSGALDHIATAIGNITRGEVPEKGENIGRAITIIDGLRDSLNTERGSPIAGNLNSLYEYMGMRLLEANRKNEISLLEEVQGLLSQIKQAWDKLPGSRFESGDSVTAPGAGA